MLAGWYYLQARPTKKRRVPVTTKKAAEFPHGKKIFVRFWLKENLKIFIHF
jgi:hypothetical protein